jgi:hypothetical protein
VVLTFGVAGLGLVSWVYVETRSKHAEDADSKGEFVFPKTNSEESMKKAFDFG